jgi:Mitochondrial ribosomal subunit protein
MSTVAAQRLLLLRTTTATTARNHARRRCCSILARSISSSSSSAASAVAATVSISSPPPPPPRRMMMPISSPTSSGSSSSSQRYHYNNSNRSFSMAAATRNVTRSMSSMVYTSPLDDILDPSAPSSLFYEPSTSSSSTKNTQEEDEPANVAALCRDNNNNNNKFLKCGIAQDALRFKTQSYGRLLNPPYLHANEHRVVLLVRLHALPFTSQLEHDILQEIVGSQRYNVERNELRLQSVQFASRIENKRHLVSMLDRLVLSCQTLAQQVAEEKDNDDEKDKQHEIKDATTVV